MLAQRDDARPSRRQIGSRCCTGRGGLAHQDGGPPYARARTTRERAINETKDDPATGFHAASIAIQRTYQATSRSGQKVPSAGTSEVEPAGIEPATSCVQRNPSE